MQFYVSHDEAGNVHVQNAIMGMLGQHHVHTPDDFIAWRKPDDEVIELENVGPCDCGLKPGEMKSGR